MANGEIIMSTENLDYRGTSCGLGEFTSPSSLRNSLRRQKEPFWIQNIRFQLQEQLKCLDIRLENHVAMLVEIQDFYKRRAEVEQDYSKNMDKLVKQIVSRHRADKRETWPGYSTYSIWQTLLSTTKKLGKDHGVLSELYANQMVFRVSELAEDTQRIYKKSMKTYHIYHGESQHAENKFRQIENQRIKTENSHSGKVVLTRRFRNIEKQSEKRQLKYMESRLRAVKARNEYLLCLEAANASMNKYFSDDLHDLINTMDYGYHSTLSRAVMLHVSAENNMIQSRNGCLDLFNKRVRDLVQKSDKQTFLDLFTQPFLPPKPFEFQAHKGDEINQLSGQKSVQEDLVERLRSIAERLNALKVENDEARMITFFHIWKTLETTDNRFLEMVTHKDYDVTRYFQDDSPQTPCSPLERDKLRSDQLETEEYYLNKFHDYQTTNNLIARLQAKYNCIEKALSDNNCSALASIGLSAVPPKPKRRKVLGKAPLAGQPQLFGGTVVEYVEASGEEIPLIVRSCVRIINLYGMHHQGVFRVSGSQIEINEFKNQFERGIDPLPDKVDGKDMNSVAGVLKLYFRELREPLFPFAMFQELINFISVNSFNNPDDLPESISRLKHLLLTSLPRPVIILMRYLFAFLNHLSEFSDENMMDPYNLAICFGPTLMPVPPELDQVLYQSHVTELVKNIILYQDEVFPRQMDEENKDSGGTIYERCEVQVEGRPTIVSEALSDEEEIIEDIISEDELDVTEALALFDFHGRTDRELSFKKGDTLIVYEKVSPDWWEGAVGDKEGLLPDKYISVQTRNKYGTFKSQEEDKFKSTESLPLKSYTLSVIRSDDLSPMSASHPNLELRHQVSAGNINNNNNNNNRSLGSNSTSSSNSSQLTNSNDDDMSTLKILTAYKPEVKDGGSNDGSGGGLVNQRKNKPFETLRTKMKSPDPPKLPDRSSSEIGKTVSSNFLPSPLHQQHITQLPQHQHHLPHQQHSTNKDDCLHHLSTAMTKTHLKMNVESNTEDLANDIDMALAEVMSGIHSLGLQVQGLDDFKRTPDLVIDLPQNSMLHQTSPKTPSTIAATSRATTTTTANDDSSNVLTTAEVFANADQCTIKKGQGIAIVSKTQQNQHQQPQIPSVQKNTDSGVQVRRQQFTDKKYATLGRAETKHLSARQNDFDAGDRNSFGKLKTGTSAVLRQHSVASADSHQIPIIPPTRTTSRLATENILEANKNMGCRKAGTITQGTATKISQALLSKSILNPFDIPFSDRRVSSPDNSCNTAGNNVEISSKQTTITTKSITSTTKATTLGTETTAPSSTTTNLSPLPSPTSSRSNDNATEASNLQQKTDVGTWSQDILNSKMSAKVKPPIMKKPARVSELSRRLTIDSQTTSPFNKSADNSTLTSKEL
ncbi:hypothetical protein HELRODRAFT_160724 [Helobdella robusta]|uniref:SLIT-ROBO Rho GTPase-activating protein 1 n=1 Tax=Helobdella robusta TaxID=6412 RepID=T1EQN1_HELRO|nr:hypothetical protein HELRODRAFT_160724 [Helobdella robusta]ESO06543.1 hypothetical protein HELRODRAFT_160724 [Helobdella robusta]